MKYRIKVSYGTGDSFRNEDTSDFIDLQWDDLGVAKENLKAVQDHYEMYRKAEDINGWSRSKYKTKQEVFEEYENNWWFVKETKPFLIKSGCAHTEEDYKKDPSKFIRKYDEYLSHHCMYLKTDSGKLMRQSNFWCGYFETLYVAEIIPKDSDMKFETNFI